jgi:hypothetical protein
MPFALHENEATLRYQICQNAPMGTCNSTNFPGVAPLDPVKGRDRKGKGGERDVFAFGIQPRH